LEVSGFVFRSAASGLCRQSNWRSDHADEEQHNEYRVHTVHNRFPFFRGAIPRWLAAVPVNHATEWIVAG
jgi:hypothetical protein